MVVVVIINYVDVSASKAAGELGMKSCFVLRDVGDDITEEQLQSGGWNVPNGFRRLESG